MAKFEPLTLRQRELLRTIVNHAEMFEAFSALCALEADAWRMRAVNEALNTGSEDPNAKLLRINEAAARAKTLADVPRLLQTASRPLQQLSPEPVGAWSGIDGP